MPQSWETLWPALLSEAVGIACSIHSGSRGEVARSSSAIVLARVAWETYVNEFVEWRDLPRQFQEFSYWKTLNSIVAELSVEPSFLETEIWSNLALVNAIRNEIVHYKPRPSEPGSSPRSILDQLQDRRVLSPAVSTTNWERQVFTAPVAKWACEIVGQSIVGLETIPARSRRSLHSVREQVSGALWHLHNTQR